MQCDVHASIAAAGQHKPNRRFTKINETHTYTQNIICPLGKLASKFLLPHLYIREAIATYSL
jgi:hypothetical protein